jgi:sterol desaturase/sphingolipid hydroxylase (fatty acid hydroxylase superfamily)
MGDLSYPDVVQWALPGFIALILFEFLWVHFNRRGGRFETRDAVASLIMGAGSVAEGILLGFVAWWFYTWLWQFALFDLGASWVAVLACFVLDDLRCYWVHRFGHRSRWVWASHASTTILPRHCGRLGREPSRSCWC